VSTNQHVIYTGATLTKDRCTTGSTVIHAQTDSAAFTGFTDECCQSRQLTETYFNTNVIALP